MAFRTSSDAADRLLSGTAQPESDVYQAEVARLLAALRSPTQSDGVREQEAVASFAAAVTNGPARLDDVRSVRHGRRTAVIAAATAAFVLLGATAGAAATGSLPDGAQSVVSKALSRVSMDVPDPDAAHAKSVDHPGPVGPDATTAAKHGLCTAWAARGKADTDRGASGNSPAFSNLRRAAHDDGMLVEDFCADVLDGSTAAGDPSSRADNGQSGDDHGQSGDDHGRAGDSPAPVATPSSGGIGNGSDASNGANATGASHAADAATQGSANADAHSNRGGTPSTTNPSAHRGR